MKLYKDFTPFSFDTHQCDDLDHLFFGPVTRNDLSGLLATSNWEVVTESILKVSSCLETRIHRFGHWTCGFEIILIHPDDEEAVNVAEEWETSLADYPVADDEHFSKMQNKAYHKCWDEWAAAEFIRLLMGELNLEDPAENLLEENTEELMGYFQSLVRDGEYHGDRGEPRLGEAIKQANRKNLRTFVKSLGQQPKAT